jgi:hypothetical protein
MRELTFDGLSPDGARLVLAGKDGQKYTVVIDERMEAAVRRDRARIGQVEIEQAGVLRPREIQARIRAGATAEDVAAASGLPIEHIRRFEGPVLTERAWVAQQAQATEVRRPGGDIELGDLVAERLHSQGVDPADIAWDAWRRDDGMWVVIATFPIPPNTHVATWTYDSSSRTMTVADDNARALSAISVEQPLRLAVARPALASVAPLDDDGEQPEMDGASAVAILGPRMIRTVAPDEDLEEPDDLEEPEEIGDELAPADLAEEIEGLPDPESLPIEPDDIEDEGDEPGEFPVDEGLEPRDELVEEEPADEADDESQALATGPTSDAEDVPLFETPNPGAHKPSGKPSVPSFDDILFGPGPSK